ncbi:hypothetical protein [Paenibacillus sp. OK060]|uniref:hypothetical protein n=1 Tax=Paenibacillus sp. OK060 TaxID=1881034 RepID=UPI00210B6413|nr:hypothetical protein [Paenibacillus sp. OK060]
MAVAFKTKDAKLKQVAFSAGISGLCGITEPALYGVHLRLKKTLFACMIGAGSSNLRLSSFYMTRCKIIKCKIKLPIRGVALFYICLYP